MGTAPGLGAPSGVDDSWPAAVRRARCLSPAIVLVGFPELSGVAFLWMALVAFHHYDSLYRALQDSGTPRWITWAGLGWDGRTLVVVGLATIGASALRDGLVVGCVLMTVLFVVLASVQWLSVQPRAGTPD